MKKLLLLLIPFLFISCFNYNIDEVTIANNSSETVTFSFDDSTITLKTGEKYIFDYVSELKVQNLKKDQRVAFSFDSYKNHKRIYSFNDITPVKYRIYNPLTEKIIITEKNNMIGNPVTPQTQINSRETTDIDVYTSNPVFSATYESGMPVDLSLISIKKL